MSDSLYLATAKEVGGEARIGAALIAIAESVAELVYLVKAQAAEPVERVAGPALGDPIGYGFAFEPEGIHAPRGHVATLIPSQRLFLTREAAESYIADPLVCLGGARLIGVYEMPQPVEGEATS